VIWRRGLLVAVLAVTGLALETSVFGWMSLVGAKPELLLLVTVALAMGEGPEIGAIAGFFMGLATDLVSEPPHGVTALVFVLVGYAVGRIRSQLQSAGAMTPMWVVLTATFVGSLALAGIGFLFGQEFTAPLRIVRRAALVSAYNALLTPFVYPVVKRLAARVRPKGVVV